MRAGKPHLGRLRQTGRACSPPNWPSPRNLACSPRCPLCVGADAELIGEVPWTPAKAKDSPKKRLVWAHDPQRALEQSTQREVRMAELLSRAEHSAAKLDAQDEGKKSKGRKLSDAGARARLYHEVIEARLGRIIKVDLKNEQLSCGCAPSGLQAGWPTPATRERAGAHSVRAQPPRGAGAKRRGGQCP